jgi:hypothetical protein
MTRGACTIVSSNYLPYASTLCESYLAFHPDDKFYVLLVDRLPEGVDLSSQPFQLVLVEDLGIPNFSAVAFKYGIVELNTNVKPTFLKKLLSLGVDQLIYFDPDILICSPVDPIYEMLSRFGIILTPHCTAPNGGDPYAEVMLLVNGVFNLGFVAVSRTEEAERFLTWWEHRCLTCGYNERWSGLFVDQKWINLVPCYFDAVKILKHPGCNVAYWNLHERALEKTTTSWIVNGTASLIFYHFSGIQVDGGNRISKYTDQFNLDSRPDLKELLAEYRDRLVRHGIRSSVRYKYAFGSYNNGELVTKIQRAAFAANVDRFGTDDPFNATGPFYKWAKRHHLLSGQDSVETFRRHSYSKTNIRVRIVNTTLRLVLRVLGADRYTVLMKYFEYVALLRNQKDIIGDTGEDLAVHYHADLSSPLK